MKTRNGHILNRIVKSDNLCEINVKKVKEWSSNATITNRSQLSTITETRFINSPLNSHGCENLLMYLHFILSHNSFLIVFQTKLGQLS